MEPALEIDTIVEGQSRLSPPGEHACLEGSVLNFVRQTGTSAVTRTRPYHLWVSERENHGLCPFQRTAEEKLGRQSVLSTGPGQSSCRLLNFSSQDYLGLAQDPRMAEAALRGIREFGVHSAGSPAFCGNTRALRRLEKRIGGVVGASEVVLYPTGWAAGYGVPSALIRTDDLILMDMLCHNCLQEGARSTGAVVRRFRHNDMAHLEEYLKEARAANARRGIFVLAEGLYSMDSDSPDMGGLLDLCETYEAISILDVAHDFGSLGINGRGLLDSAPDRLPDVVLGSFSKTFAANGGFAAARPEVVNYLRYHSPTSLFSNAIAPMQTYVADKAFEVAFSTEGADLRRRLMERVNTLRGAMAAQGLEVAGQASPICPVFVGDERLARLTARHAGKLGIAANLVEFPAVRRGKARFRFQMMATHLEEDALQAAEIMAGARRLAEVELKELRGPHHA